MRVLTPRLLVTAAAFALVAAAGPSASAAATERPVETNSVLGFLAGFPQPGVAPDGANDWSCKPGPAHPNPVVLVHGSFENMNDNWGGAAPLLANNGYCVFAFNYGAQEGNPIQGTGPIELSAAQLGDFVDRVTAATGAAEVDLVGHSQGGMMPRYYLKNLGGAAKVDKLIGLAPSNHGTTLLGLSGLASALGVLEPANRFLLGPACPACVQQEQGSPFVTALNAGGDTVPGVRYTVIASRFDEVVTPYDSAFLTGPEVDNITLQDGCPLDAADHLEIAYDPVALIHVLNALDPAHPRQVPCAVVLPAVGPLV
ncbi:triacylglycerol esterase/lipase EstA (alpha/beta hydrolase family) [Kitasatospora gansuensis]|uniref:Triacylglycerol esterase/lipase EstA (Alpha/beta hydrolase family) n=1 Tax=Kitasatospora gansuensis TaxID=258050 RepID=A0A7W7S9W2_9ACTN|nr:alpha/beta fold hydrolase [Kitasatospora gansuensis]MBB4946147.1 triacylglycerol esterase/lipase EstA (alpha/beta hydrolase family) [Kitasatospora gansuensis]